MVVYIVHLVVYIGNMEDSEPEKMTGAGYELPLLLAASFREIIDRLHAELAEHGHPGARPIHGFALQAIGPDGVTASELGRRLGVSKQAAAKTASGLEALGYVKRESDPGDGRATRIVRSERGAELLALSQETFTRIRAEWAEALGEGRLGSLERDLATMAPRFGLTQVAGMPGWLR